MCVQNELDSNNRIEILECLVIIPSAPGVQLQFLDAPLETLASNNRSKGL